jgi:hypothetical protein
MPVMKRSPESTLWLIVTTIFWVPFQAILFTPISLDALLKISNSEPYSDVFSYNPWVFLAYMSLPIVYCSIASLVLFKPKRMVPPLHIQLLAFFLFCSMLIVSSFSKMPLNSSSILATLILFAIFAFLAIGTGLFQQIFVRLVIGLDYFETSINRATGAFSINADFNTVKTSVLNDIAFTSVHKFKKIIDAENACLYKIVLSQKGSSKKSLVVSLTPDPLESGKSLLSLVGYEQTFDCVQGLEDANYWIENIRKEISYKLFDINVVYDIEAVKDTENHATFLAKQYVKQPSRSIADMAKGSLLEAWQASHYHVLAICVLIAILAFVTVALWRNLWGIDPNTYINILIGVSLVFVAELGISLKEELSHRRARNIDK